MTLQDQVIRKHQVHTNYQFNFSCLLGNKNVLQCICGNTLNGLTYLYPESGVCACVCFQQENYLNNMYIMSENYLSIFFGERSVRVFQMMIKLAKCTCDWKPMTPKYLRITFWQMLRNSLTKIKIIYFS